MLVTDSRLLCDMEIVVMYCSLYHMNNDAFCLSVS